MRKRGLDAVTASIPKKHLNNENAVIGDKGCDSAGWKEEMANQRCMDLLEWMLGRR